MKRPKLNNYLILLLISIGSLFVLRDYLVNQQISAEEKMLVMARTEATPRDYFKEAMFYEKLENELVQCHLCPRSCVIAEGKRGLCRVRENRSGKLLSLVYGNLCTVDIGPIEKAPLYHFLPGHERLCLATVGCNLSCKYCHNWHISQAAPGERRVYNLTPQEIVEQAKRARVRSISFTYTEPTIFFEYVYDISKLAKKEGLMTSIVSNGYINPEPLRKLLEVIDVVKIDLKAFTEEFYRDVVGDAELEPVLNTLRILREEDTFFEIVNLVVPSLNDAIDDIREMCLWIKENLGESTPLHFTRFTPAYRMTHLQATPIGTLERAIDIAKEIGLQYVYIGNVPGHKYNSTFCPNCEERLIHRIHFSVRSNKIQNGRCQYCHYQITGVWDYE